jgi:hypothetical protein
LIHEVTAAWIAALLAVAIGLLLLAFHQPDTENRLVPRWYEPPVAEAEEWADDPLLRRSADRVMAQSGISTVPIRCRGTGSDPIQARTEAGCDQRVRPRRTANEAILNPTLAN